MIESMRADVTEQIHTAPFWWRRIEVQPGVFTAASKELDGDPSNWWSPNQPALGGMFETRGA